MKKNLWITALLLLLVQIGFGQKVTGYIYDAGNDNAPMQGVSIYYTDKGSQKGTVSNAEGYYELPVPEGGIILTYSFLGYETRTLPLVVERRENLKQDVYMKPSADLLDAVVVSVGRFEQKLSDVTVSMDVLQSEDIAKQNPSDIRATLTTLPGVDIVDKQPSIRGGSGWTYGVGSRSLILVDGMSILSPAGGEINWNAIPMENIEQVEVIKGASSVLYGSSALNGLINVRTSRPGPDPVTHVNAYMGIYGNPENKDYIWWSRDFWKEGKYEVDPLLRKTLFYGVRNPMYNGLDFSHTRRIGNWDVAGSLNLFTDEGYKQGAFNKRVRVGGSFTHHDPTVDGLHYGLNVNFMSDEAGDAFLWRSPEEAYEQSPLTNMSRQGNELYVDPFLTYYNADNHTTHRLKSRLYFTSDNIVTRSTDKSLFDIAGNMGFDYANSLPELLDIVNNPLQLVPTFLPHITEALNTGDVTGLMGAIGNVGNHFFPNAKPADYVDLISWISARSPLPALNGGDLINWVLDTDKTKPKQLITPDRSASYYVDYQFNKDFGRAQITTGLTYEHVTADTEMTGDHRSDNAALYFQYDDKFFGRLNLSLGARFEYYRVDSHYREAETKVFGTRIPVKPVLRGGLNYQLGKNSYLRASVGQGYRYPSITEKYIYKNIGGIAAYPNANLKAESGFNTELGFRQGYRFGPFSGYLDIAGFYTEYKNMIEFNIGLFNTSTFEYVDNLRDVFTMVTSGQMPGIGAQFYNVDKARIYGVDFSINGICTLTPHTRFTYNLGYVYLEPEDVNYKERNAVEDAYTDPLQLKVKSNNSRYLKYRQKHSVKGVIDFQWRRLTLGTNLSWKSKTEAVDYFMVDERPKAKPEVMDYVRGLLFGDLNGYWKENNKGHFVMDVRAGVKVTNNMQFQLSINNLLNEEYCVRPMDVSAPRTFVFQVSTNF